MMASLKVSEGKRQGSWRKNITGGESELAYTAIIKTECAHLRTQTHRPCSGDPRMILEGVKHSFTAILTFEQVAVEAH